MENNQYGKLKTEFDDRKALIIGNHPHADEVAICKGADRLITGYGLYFENVKTGESFYVFKGQNVKWLNK